MQLTLGGQRVIDHPTRNQLALILTAEFAILSEADLVYLQCAPADDGYVLEYQAGSLNEHFTAEDAPLPGDRVVAAFWQYAQRDGTWRDDFVWTRMDLSAPPPPAPSRRPRWFNPLRWLGG